MLSHAFYFVCIHVTFVSYLTAIVARFPCVWKVNWHSSNLCNFTATKPSINGAFNEIPISLIETFYSVQRYFKIKMHDSGFK